MATQRLQLQRRAEWVAQQAFTPSKPMAVAGQHPIGTKSPPSKVSSAPQDEQGKHLSTFSLHQDRWSGNLGYQSHLRGALKDQATLRF